MTVYLSEYIAPSARKRLEEKFNIVSDFSKPEELDGILIRRVNIGRELIEKAKNLKVISIHGVGLDPVDIEAAEEFGVQVTNVQGQNAESVAELAVSFILALSRKHKLINNGLVDGKFDKFGMVETIGNEVYGKKLGLVGGGNIAGRIAEIMKTAFSAQIYCYDPYKSEAECKKVGYQKIDTIEALFKTVDYVSINVPLVHSTRNLINKTAFKNANPNLIMVNTARGGVVNEDDLYSALIHNKIKAAASDVFLNEPPSKESPLLGLDNFIATLHVGGSTEEALERVSNCAVDHLIDGVMNRTACIS